MSTITFNATAGVLVRGRIRRAIKKYAWERGSGIKIEEDKGLLASLMRFTITLPEDKYDLTYRELKQWFSDIEEDK